MEHLLVCTESWVVKDQVSLDHKMHLKGTHLTLVGARTGRRLGGTRLQFLLVHEKART